MTTERISRRAGWALIAFAVLYFATHAIVAVIRHG
jgi:hypothetical protein